MIEEFFYNQFWVGIWSPRTALRKILMAQQAAIRSSRKGVPVACCAPKQNRWACAGEQNIIAPAIKADGENDS
jgi:hypothetical protein